MFYLSKEQLKLLKSLTKTKENISNSQEKMILFLESLEFVNVDREIIQTFINAETHKYQNTYGKIISVSISEHGKAFLSEWKHDRLYFWIPIIIDSLLSITAIIISIISLTSCPY